ncbi:hypothetical protein LEP1GSC173_0067 [Leptospira interrogans str. HAI1594]|uniref:Uncharacterized protein n=5 Tax=Leptospira interrogans TaxID=173 RepID=M3FUY5_LEPIR|nr:hypothetical protein LEP1GSC057_2529 [Leptospira interrogans str. Brem 329]EKP21877.1 hypothetical protein LEP1GSC117_0229 [Leptospira interrogans serovar Icterohaemorrhagiae str. Verdun LP]EKP74977.1 hypothetical protein LEP1GSC173_0067 [Leptospira interrogans str. HAI1594]EKR46250.1 hypothetical protein LEP1GSC097_1883 [Leptospira interrogans serovar Grippotyphosa str. UI 08368]EMF40882.1 hypothetical protein LEP1GSC067_2298 [Leptospira interrogans serovar Lora str. TE 1992]EMG11229.1 hyp
MQKIFHLETFPSDRNSFRIQSLETFRFFLDEFFHPFY